MKKLLILMVVLLNSILLGGQALDVRTLSKADFGPEYKAYLKQQQSLAKDGLSFNLVEIPFNLPAAGDPTFMQGNTWVKDFATYINGYTFGDPLFMYWSQSERFLIEAVEGFPTKLSFTPLEAVWHGSETISITISDIELGPGAMGQSTWLFNVSVSNQLDAPVFSFPNLATEIPNGYIFSTPEDTPITIDFVTNMPGTELPYIYSVDNLENPSAIQLFVTPTSASVGFSQLNSGAGLGTEVTFYPPENVVGDYQDYTFGLTARDRVYDVISERTIVLRVTQVNDPPEILEVKVDTVPVDDVMGPFDQGSSHQLEAVATDMDGDSIFYRWILEGENGSVELGTNGSLDYLFNDPGFFTLTLYVRDREDGSGFEVSRAWDITVSPVGPQFTPLGSEGPFSAALDVEISAPGVEDATIYYSIGGDTGPWTEYSGPVNIPLHTNPPEAYEQVIWAYFVLPGGLESVHQFQTYQMTGTVQIPVFSHASGRYLPNNPDSSIGSDFLLSLSTIPVDAEIRYSLDGGSSWLLYTAPGIQIPTQSRVNLLAKAGKTGWLDSPESAVHSYVINDQVVFGAPTMITDPAPDPDGSYCVCFGDSVKVDFSALTTVPAAANIYYSVEPLGLPGEAVVYSYDPGTGDPFTLYVTDSSTIRWWAEYSDPALPGEVAQYYPSATHSYDFDVKNRTVMLYWDDISNPTVFDPIPQSLPQYYDAPINIAINTEVSPDTGIAAEIWYQYKFDNMPDFGDWALYTDPLAADRDVSIRAYAKAMPPYTTMDSEIHEADYSITGTLPLPLISHTSPPEDSYNSPFSQIGGTHTFSENLKVSLQMPEGDRWQDAVIFYSLDDGLSYVAYTAPITLSAGHYKFSAYAAKPNWNDSVVSNTAEYFVKFLPPVTFSSNDGPLSIPDPLLPLSEHYQQIEVSLFSEDGASIRYEWGEGVVPDATSSSPLYSAPIVMGAATLTEPKEYTLKVIATKAGWVNSEQISWTFSLVPTMPDPVFSPEDSNHPSAINVSIAVLPAPEGTFEVWYLEDPSGSDIPGPGNGILYAGQFEVDSSRIIAARAYKDGFRPSSVVYKAYNIANTIGDIVFNPVAGTYTAVQNVSLSVLPAEANLFYSFDNVTWTPYTTAIPLGLGTQSTIYAKAELAGSETKTGQASYTVLAEPEILPLQSQYATGASIDISITAPVGDLYYILNGADPVLGVSPVILNGITESTEIEAWVENGGIQTEHIVRTYTFNAQLSAPVANYVSGTYYDALSVVLSQPQNADIYYSTDNVTFTAYSGVISINQNQSLYAFATKENHPQSETREWTYTLKVRNPQASLASGEYAGSREVALSVNTAGASILYNNVSADLPPESWSVYAGNPISVDENTEFWLKGVKDNWLSSETVYLNYIINGAVQDVSFSPVAATYYDTQMVALSSVTPDAEIRYSVDGSSPSLIYSGPLAVDQNTRIRARAYKSNWLPSAESSAQYFLKVSGLSDGGVTTIHYDEFQVKLSTGTADTEIYYTLSTGIPDILYTGPITISGSSTLRAVAKRNNWLDSEMYQRSFVINQRVATPSISPAGGLFNYSPVEVELTCLTADADILYRTSVTGAWQAYLNLLSITETTLIQAKATKEGWVDSEISTVQFIIEIPVTPQVATPAFSPLPGTFNVPQSVTLTSATPDADIYYTLDGSDPDPASATLYTGAIAVDNSLTIKAIAVKAGWDNSEIASAEYVIAPLQVLDPIVFPDSGTYNAPFNVVIINPTVGATTLYQMNLETETWTVYDPANPINIMESSSLRVKSVKDLMIDSAVIERNYVLTGTVSLAALSLDPAPGSYQTLQSVFYSGAPDPADAVIRFTTNGVDPTEADPIFDSALNPPLDSSLNLKLRAFKEDWLPSAVITGNYLFTGQVALPADMFSPAAGTYQTEQIVTLKTNTSPAGATIHYSIDGTDPTEDSAIYSSGITLPLNSVSTIKAKAFLADWTPSVTYEASYNITGTVSLAALSLDPAPGSYQTLQSVFYTGAPDPADAVIRFTTNGIDPTEADPIFDIALTPPLDSSLTLKLRGFKADWTPSEVITGNYLFTGQVALPADMFSPAAGIYTSAQTVYLDTNTSPAGARLRYTLNGDEPDESSPAYSESGITINNTSILKIKGFKEGWLPSVVQESAYTITGSVVISSPVFTPAAGTYQSAQSVTIGMANPVTAVVHYTLDGTEPDQNSPIYSEAIELGENSVTTIKAKAFLADWTPSVTYEASYNITGTVSLAALSLDPAPGSYQTLQSVFYTGAPDPADAVIRFTTNGIDPTEADPIFDIALTPPLDSSLTLKLRGFKADWTPSEVITGNYLFTGQVALPADMFSPAAGTYTSAQTVILNTGTTPEGATLRFTTNGMDPTPLSPIYTNGIILPLGSGITQVKVRGFLDGWIPSSVVSATYNITGQVVFNNPVFAPAAGTYANAVHITVNTTIPADAIIRYTTDGSEPTESSPATEGGITLSAMNTAYTVKVKAFKPDWISSATQTAVYVLTGQAEIASPTFDPAPGIYQQAQSVSISNSLIPTNATIRYTLDGSNPTASSPVYSAPIPIPLDSDITIRARAFAENWTPSEVYVGHYTVTGQVVFDIDPVFSPSPGIYATAQVVNVSQPYPADATIHYTLDGSEPTQEDPILTRSINLSDLDTAYTIKVKAFKSDWIASDTQIANYQITGQVSFGGTIFTPEAGAYQTAQDVEISATVYPLGSQIRYSLNGEDPTEESDLYEPGMLFNVPVNTPEFSLKIRAFNADWSPSEVLTGIYSVTGTVQLAESLFSPAPGTFTLAQTVSLSAPILPTDAVLRYTTDGSDPTEKSPAYTAPIMIPLHTDLLILKVRGFSENWISSEVITGSYIVTGTLSDPLFSLESGTYGNSGDYENGLSIELSGDPDVIGLNIYYSTDGSDPTEDSILYTEPITVPEMAQNFTIRAKAIKKDWISSGISEETYSYLMLPLNVRTVTYEGYVRVLWGSPTTRSLDGFNVYRKASNESDFRKLNDELVPVSQTIGSDHYYDDYEIANNMSYQYYVKAVYNGMESVESTITGAEYQSSELDVTENSRAYPNPAENSTTLQIRLSRNDNVQITVSIFDFAGKKVRTLTGANLNTNLVEIIWDLKNDSGTKVGRGTYFARIQASDSAKRSEKVIKISVK